MAWVSFLLAFLLHFSLDFSRIFRMGDPGWRCSLPTRLLARFLHPLLLLVYPHIPLPPFPLFSGSQ
jgi:hypothetical protein